jgi:MSHA biogenesis protein MshP
MCLDHNTPSKKFRTSANRSNDRVKLTLKSNHNIKGFSLPLAIFILVIVSLLALAIFRMTALNQNSVTQEVLTARALFAAESGAQAQMMRLFPLSGIANCSAQTINFNSAGLNNCSASSTCVNRIVNGTTYYTIESNGRCTVAGFTALRTIEVEAK